MIRMLIADDMPMQMHMLEQMVRKLRPDYEIITARDGLEILRIAQESPPDIILSDIRMPRMDGLEMLKHIKQDFPHVQVVFLTGYALFEYAQKALKHGASDILIKPIDEETLESTLQKLEETIRGVEPTLGSDWLLAVNQWLNDPPEYLTTRYLHSIHSRFASGGWVAVGYIKRDPGSSPCEKQKLLNAVRRHIAPFNGAEVFPSLRDHHLIAIIAPSSRPDLLPQVTQLMNELAAHHSLSVGMSFYQDSLAEHGHEAHQMALNALNVAFYTDRMLSSSQSALRPTPVNFLNADQLSELMHMHATERDKRLDRALDRMREERPFFPDMIEHTALSAIALLEGLRKSTRNDALTALWQRFAMDLRQAGGWSEYTAILRTTLNRVVEALSAYEEQTRGGAVAQCLVYLREHYMEPITISDMANRYSLTPNYFSALFKRETGQRFVEYLSQLRLNMAADQLVRTNLFVYEIANQCGYENERYFIRVFQSVYGLSPSAYRKKYRKEL